MRSLLLVVLLCLAACTRQGWNDRLSSPQEQALALKIAGQLRAGQLEEVATEAAPELRQQLPGYLKQVAPLLRPIRGEFRLQTVSSFSLSGGPTTKTFIMQGGSGEHWAVLRVVLHGTGRAMQLAGLNVTPFRADPSEMDRFDISRRGLLGYFWLAIMSACIGTCLWAVVLIWRARWLKRRWLWTVGSLLGFLGFGLNWSTGAWAILFVNVSLFGAQAIKAGPYAPWLLSFGFPVVALIVIVRWYRGGHQDTVMTER